MRFNISVPDADSVISMADRNHIVEIVKDSYRFRLFKDDEPKIGIIIGTGPSLTTDQLDQVKDYRKFGVNNAIEFGLDVHLACNISWWDYYWNKVKDLPCDKWTTRPELDGKYQGLNYIKEVWIPGLSTDKSCISAHHGSGPQMINLAYHYGCKVMILIGWDMRHKGKRHYFGEYPAPMQHFTKNLGPGGELTGLINEMATIKPEDYGIEIINCTPDSAMTCFPMMDLKDCLKQYE